VSPVADETRPGFMKSLLDHPATHELMSNAGKFAAARAAKSAGDITTKIAGGGRLGQSAGGAVKQVLEDTGNREEDTDQEDDTGENGGKSKGKGKGKISGAWSAIKGAVQYLRPVLDRRACRDRL
jgi:hypothetical protein